MPGSSKLVRDESRVAVVLLRGRIELKRLRRPSRILERDLHHPRCGTEAGDVRIGRGDPVNSKQLRTGPYACAVSVSVRQNVLKHPTAIRWMEAALDCLP